MNQTEHDLRMREAALVLHGLHWRDRLWLLRKLLPAWRGNLARLLGELRQLGIEQAFGDSHALPPSLAHASLDDTELALVSQASSSQILALLADEPVPLQAHALALHAWPWRQAVWKSLGSLQRRRLLAHASADQPLPPCVAAALLAALAAALRDARPSSAIPGGGGA